MNSARLKLFEDVRAVVAGRIRDEGQIRELAQRISEESTDLRRRVDRAVSYARGGLRLEACAEAEAEPSVFELSAAFDSQHMRQWREWCIKQRLPHSEEVPPELVAEVEEAIALTKPLRNKLASMRRLVLSDASAWQRLEILRVLVARDPENHAWQEDRDAMEPVAAKELSGRVDTLLARGDVPGAAECVQRLEDGKWQWGGIGKVAAQARAKHDRALAQRLAEEARETVARLDAEWSAENEDGVRAVLGGWEILSGRMSGCGGQMPAAAAARVAAAAEWLAGREDSAAAVRDNRDRVAELSRIAQLESATAPQLRAALRAAEQTSEGVPDEVRAVAERRLDEFGRRTARMRIAAVAAVVLVLLAVGALALLQSRNAARDLRVAASHRAMAEHLVARRFGDARSELEELRGDAELGTHPGLSAMQADLESAEASERKRGEDWKQQFDTAGRAGAETSDRGKVEDLLKAAQTDSERDLARSWLRDDSDKRRAAIVDREKAASDELDAIEAAIKDPRVGDRRERLLDAGTRLNAVRDQSRGLDSVPERVKRLSVALDAATKSMDEAADADQRRQSLLLLGARASDPAQLDDALKAFIDDDAGSPVAAEFEEARKSVAAWKAITAWASLPARPGGKGALAVSQQDCTQRDAALAKYLAEHPATPYADAVARFRLLLRQEDGCAWRPTLTDLVKGPLWDLRQCEPKGTGKRWYTKAQPADVKSSKVQVIVGFKKDSGDLVVDYRDLGPSPSLVESAQSRVAKAIAKELARRKEAPAMVPTLMESAFQLFDRIAASDMDAVLKARTLQLLAEQLAVDLRGTALEKPLVDLDQEIRALLLTDAAWPNPDDLDAASAREGADRLLAKKLEMRGGRSSLHRLFESEVEAACAELERTYQPAGVLVPLDGRKEIVLRPGQELPARTELLVVDAGTGKARLQRVAEVGADGSVKVDDAVAGQFPGGTMVFRRQGGRP